MAGAVEVLRCDRCGVRCTVTHILLECDGYNAFRTKNSSFLRFVRGQERFPALLVEDDRFTAAPLFDFLKEENLLLQNIASGKDEESSYYHEARDSHFLLGADNFH